MANRLNTIIALLALSGCAVPQPDPIDNGEIPWNELFPTEDTISSDIGEDTLVWPPEGVELLTGSCAAGEQRRIGGTVFYDGPEIPAGASLYLLLSEQDSPTGMPDCFMGPPSPTFPLVFEFQEVWNGEPRYVMALLKMDGKFPPIPGPDDWFARIPAEGPLAMDGDVFWLELNLAPYEEGE